eukprot:gnl/MRDRNA2_/MRDRNA2_28475_c0_seq1.p1 gnl/MRDRNA2_/MRDRNA2_28475_c0~~gnl/MRDRNA2_/MRDRNA2_28475_c0_seq1.p1  ORF type:complete len:1148 (+),score=267.13 gnl/MRDRNA2_/MRDRNA2_28475_c0_seq1:130-3573(+)
MLADEIHAAEAAERMQNSGGFSAIDTTMMYARQNGVKDDMVKIQIEANNQRVDKLSQRIDVLESNRPLVGELEVLKVNIAEEWDRLQTEIHNIWAELKVLQQAPRDSLGGGMPNADDLVQQIANAMATQEEQHDGGFSPTRSKKWSEKEVHLLISQRHEDLEKHFRKDLDVIEERFTKALYSMGRSTSEDSSRMHDIFSDTSKLHSDMEQQKMQWQTLDRKCSETMERLQRQFESFRQSFDTEIMARDNGRRELENTVAKLQQEVIDHRIAAQQGQNQFDGVNDIQFQLQRLDHRIAELHQGEKKLREEGQHGLELQMNCLRNDLMNQSAEIRTTVQKIEATQPSFEAFSREVAQLFDCLKEDLKTEKRERSAESSSLGMTVNAIAKNQLPSVVQSVDALRMQVESISALRKQIEDVPDLVSNTEVFAKQQISVLESKLDAAEKRFSSALETTIQMESESRRSQYETLTTKFVNEIVAVKSFARDQVDLLKEDEQVVRKEDLHNLRVELLSANEEKAGSNDITNVINQMEMDRSALKEHMAVEQRSRSEGITNVLNQMELDRSARGEEMTKVINQMEADRSALQAHLANEQRARSDEIATVINQAIKNEEQARSEEISNVINQIEMDRSALQEHLANERKARSEEITNVTNAGLKELSANEEKARSEEIATLISQIEMDRKERTEAFGSLGSTLETELKMQKENIRNLATTIDTIDWNMDGMKKEVSGTREQLQILDSQSTDVQFKIQVLESELKNEKEELAKLDAHCKKELTEQLDSLSTQMTTVTEEVQRVPQLVEVENELIRRCQNDQNTKVSKRLDELDAANLEQKETTLAQTKRLSDEIEAERDRSRKMMDKMEAERNEKMDAEKNERQEEISQLAARLEKDNAQLAARFEKENAQLAVRLEKIRYAIIPLPDQTSEKEESKLREIQLHGVVGVSGDDPVVKEAVAQHEHDADISELRSENERLVRELHMLRMGLGSWNPNPGRKDTSPGPRMGQPLAPVEVTPPVGQTLGQVIDSDNTITRVERHLRVAGPGSKSQGVLIPAPKSRPVTPAQQRQCAKQPFPPNPPPQMRANPGQSAPGAPQCMYSPPTRSRAVSPMNTSTPPTSSPVNVNLPRQQLPTGPQGAPVWTQSHSQSRSRAASP